MSETRILGIRHHGPGSARSLVQTLPTFRPEVLLIEAPAGVESLFPLVNDPDLKPPVAILAYVTDEPRQAAFYPFAEFSPEWNAIKYGLQAGIPIRAIDLPASVSLARDESGDGEEEDEIGVARSGDGLDDPMAMIAVAAGYSDGELWWDHTFEQRWSHEDPFEAVAELMTALRGIGFRHHHLAKQKNDDGNPEPDLANPSSRDVTREAHMRLAIREATTEFDRVAVVCGAWHVPALGAQVKVSEDKALLKDMPKVKVSATWVPWTYERLAFASGYPAGVISPAYYEILWRSDPEAIARNWLIQAARLLRGEDLPASTASVIEAVRLSETLACVRGLPSPGLSELADAVKAVFTHGDVAPLRLIERRLIIGEKLGEIPPDTPSIPIQADLAAQQRRLRLKPEALERTLDLDLRNETDLARSKLLHRLNLLEIEWGLAQPVSGKLGTFHELWSLQWRPEFAISVVIASRWGATVEAAAAQRAIDLAAEFEGLGELAGLARAVLTAGLPDALEPVLDRLRDEAAISTSAGDLLDTLPPLGWIVRYGDVRGTDTGLVRQVFDSIFTRGCISLPQACVSLDDGAAAAMAGRLDASDGIVALLEDADHVGLWRETLAQVADLAGAHGLVTGRAARLLFDAGAMPADEIAARLSQAASPGAVPAETAAWIEGLLGKSGALLLHEERLWTILDAWIMSLREETFLEILPLLRRTFSVFPPAERRQLGERAKGSGRSNLVDEEIDEERATRPLPLLRLILGLEEPL